MSGISFMGVGSGLPVNDIINATLKAEAAPLQRLENDKKFYQSQISALGQLNSRLSTMRTAMLDLRGQDKFNQLAAKPGNDKLFTATADHLAGATAGNYNIEVLAEARNYRQVSKSVDTDVKLTAGVLTFTKADGTPLTYKKTDGTEANIDPITIDADMSLEELRQKINSNEQLKGLVSANIVNEGEGKSRLVLNSAVSGEAGRFQANFPGSQLEADATLSSADFQQVVYDAMPEENEEQKALKQAYLANNLNARIKIDGIEASSSTNTFSNVVSGVTINVTQGAMNEASKISSLQVGRDDKAIRDNIDQFVKAYNDVIIHLNEAKKGSLYGDNTIRTVEAEMRNILYTPTPSSLDPNDPKYDEDTQKNFLALIGIEVYTPRGFDPENPDSQNGTLRVNSNMLNEALENDFDRVAHILGASDFADDSGVDGYAARFADLSQRLTSTTTQNGQLTKGLLEVRREGLNNQVKRVDDRIESTNMRLELLEDRLKRQFAAIEGLVANFNSSGSFLAQQMNNLPGYTRPKR